MGISLVSSTTLANSSQPAAPATTGEAATDFAALLGGQLGDLAQLIGSSRQLAGPGGQTAAPATDKDSDATDPAADPDLLPYLAATADLGPNRPLPPQTPTQSTAAEAVAGSLAGSRSDLPAPLLAEASPPREGAAGLRKEAIGSGQATAADIFAGPANPSAKIAGDEPPAEPRLTDPPAPLAPFAARPEAQSVAAVSPQGTGRVDTPLTDPRWAKDMGDHVVWMARNDQQTAHLSLNPPQLGPLQITLSLSGDQASAVFASPHAEVRRAIEDAMPQLREMLSASGINLGQADVGAQAQQQNPGNTAPWAGSARFSDDKAILHGNPAPAGASAPSLTQRGRGLVDLFA